MKVDSFVAAAEIDSILQYGDYRNEQISGHAYPPCAFLNVARDRRPRSSATHLRNGQIDDVSVVCGAVQCIPRRLHDVEALLRGRTRNEETATLAGAEAIRGAEPLDYNHFKIPLMENLVKRAVRG